VPELNDERMAAAQDKILYLQVLIGEGAEIAELVRELVLNVREILLQFDEEEFPNSVVIVRGDDRLGRAPFEVESLSSLRRLVPIESDLLIEVTLAGQIRVSYEAVSHQPEATRIKYVLGPDGEKIVTPATTYATDPPSGSRSQFGVSSFVAMNEALSYYALHVAKFVDCAFLKDAWFDTGRILHTNKPEAAMRDSLLHFLKVRLRDSRHVVVMPEQNVNATNPVDIRVTWMSSNHMALIEVKWLGDSINAVGTGPSSTKFRDSRAIEGYVQLLEYLKAQDQTTPHQVARGYLAVFDGRRGGIGFTNGAPTASRPHEYRSADIDYSAQETHPRMAPPTRMYVEVAAA